jgi:hypothetical protein
MINLTTLNQHNGKENQQREKAGNIMVITKQSQEMKSSEMDSKDHVYWFQDSNTDCSRRSISSGRQQKPLSNNVKKDMNRLVPFASVQLAAKQPKRAKQATSNRIQEAK